MPPTFIKWNGSPVQMKMSTLAWAGMALTSVFMVLEASAQELRQPLSVRPVGFNYANFEANAAPDEKASESIGSGAIKPVSLASPACSEPAQ